jgi:hypothetical protein
MIGAQFLDHDRDQDDLAGGRAVASGPEPDLATAEAPGRS